MISAPIITTAVITSLVWVALALLVNWIDRRESAKKNAEAPIPKPTISVPIFTTLSLAQWRASDERVKYAAGLMETPLFRQLLGVLQNEMPRVYPREGTNAVEAQFALNIVPGYQRCLETLLLTAKRIEEPAEMPNETYPNPAEQPE